MKSEQHIVRISDGHILYEFWGDGEQYYTANLHRIDGPAFISYYISGDVGTKEYWILNSQITEEEFYTPGFVDAFILEHS